MFQKFKPFHSLLYIRNHIDFTKDHIIVSEQHSDAHFIIIIILLYPFASTQIIFTSRKCHPRKKMKNKNSRYCGEDQETH
jgi:hypothetical protein